MIDELGVRVAASVLPLSDTPMCRAPLLLKTGSLLRYVAAELLPSKRRLSRRPLVSY